MFTLDVFKINTPYLRSHVEMDVSNDVAFVSFSNGGKEKISICAKDLSTGEVMMTYVGGACMKGTLNLIGSQYIMGADEHRPVIYLWALNKMYPLKTIQAVGKIGCLATSSSSSICVGSVDERMYMWMIHTGDLTRSITYHCTKITCIKFSTSGLDFVTCDNHGSVALWNANRLMTIDTKMGSQPIMTFTGHSAKVTDAHLNETYLTTSSLDKTVRIWYLRTGEPYRCIDFEGAVTSVTMNPSLTHLVVGFNEARLAMVDFTRERRKDDGTFVVNSDVVCMSWTMEGVLLYGDETGTVGLMTPDMTYADELFTHNGGGITNIITAPFLPRGWNDTSKSSTLDIVPLSDKLREVPDHLGAPINFHKVSPIQIQYPKQPLIQTDEVSKNDSNIITGVNNINDNVGAAESIQNPVVNQIYSDLLNSLLTK